MGAAGLIARKDLLLRVRDRSAFVLGVLAPLVLAFIFNLILGDLDTGGFTPEYAVTNLDSGGEIAEGFVGVIDQIESDGVIVITERPATEEAARSLARQGDVAAAIVIPDGFSAAVQGGEEATILVIVDPDAPTSAQIARSIADGFAAEVKAAQVAIAAAAGAGRLGDAEIAAIAQRAAAGLPGAIAVGTVETGKRELDLATFFAASMSVFFLFFTVSFGVNGLIEETQLGTIRRLLAAPIRASSIVIGKAIVSFVLGLVAMTLLIVASSLLLGAEWGNPVGVALLVIMGVVAATGMMMVVAAFARTPEQAGNLQAILAVGLGMLGGIFFPSSLGTGVLSYLAYISPHRWFLLGLGDLSGGDGISVIVPSMLGLAAFAGVSWLLAMWRFQRKGVMA